MKHVIVIPDGAADKPVKALGSKTPFEAARTPVIDRLASRSVVGLSDNIPAGFTPGTDIGCLSLFGYDPALYYTGRGPLEAAQLGLKLEKDDLAFRCNLVTEEDGILKDFSADHVPVSEARQLMEALNRAFRGLPVKFHSGMGTGYRNVMILSQAPRTTLKAKLAPPHDIMGESVKKHLPRESAEPLLRRLMLESRDILEKHPVNVARAKAGKGKANLIWLWGQGKTPKWPTYADRFNKKGAVVTAVDLVKGIGIFAGLDILNVPGVTGFFDTNYEGKAAYALESLKIRDIAVIHIEATDEAGHMGRADLKVKAIEDIDARLMKPLIAGLERFEDYRVLIAPDHFTCLATRTHSKDPVPYLLYSSRKAADGPAKYCEKTAAAGNTKPRKGHELIELLING